MAHPHPAAPSRRVPIQARAHVTVDAVIAATAQILLKEGYDACTTNHVARVAGVSIGSLYQYFPDKDALIIAVMEQHLTRTREFLEARLAEMGDLPLPQAIHEMVRAMLDVHRIQPRLHRVLVEQVPRIGELKRIHELNAQFVPAVTAWLEAREDERLGHPKAPFGPAPRKKKRPIRSTRRVREVRVERAWRFLGV